MPTRKQPPQQHVDMDWPDLSDTCDTDKTPFKELKRHDLFRFVGDNTETLYVSCGPNWYQYCKYSALSFLLAGMCADDFYKYFVLSILDTVADANKVQCKIVHKTFRGFEQRYN